jgi:hypothetical protein
MTTGKLPVPIFKKKTGKTISVFPLYCNYCCIKDQFRHVVTYSNVSLVDEGLSTLCILTDTSYKQK